MSWADEVEDKPAASPWGNTSAPAPATSNRDNQDYPRLDQQQRKAPVEGGRREDYDNRGRNDSGRGRDHDNRQGGYDNQERGEYDNRQEGRPYDNRGGYDNRGRGGYDNRGRGGYDNNRQDRGYDNNRQDRGYDNRQRHDNNRGGYRDDYRGHDDRRQPPAEHHDGAEGHEERDNRGERGHYDNRRGGYRDYGERRPPVERVERERHKNPIPDQPPFTAFIANVSWDATDQDLGDHFDNAGCKVKSVKIIIDRNTNRPKGFAYVEFEDRESLEKAVTELDGSTLMERSLRVDVPDEKPDRPQRREGRDNSFYTKSRDPTSTEERAPPAERPKFNVLPRTIPLDKKDEPAPVSDQSANPFGGARPRDEQAWQKKQEEREKERKQQEEEKKSKELSSSTSALSSSSSSIDKPQTASPVSDKEKDKKEEATSTTTSTTSTTKSTKPEGGRRGPRDNKEHQEGHRFRSNQETTWEPKESKEVRDAQRAAQREQRDAKDNKPQRDNKDNRPPRDNKDKPAVAKDAKPSAEKPQGKKVWDNKPAAAAAKEEKSAPAAKEAKTKAPAPAPLKKAAAKVTNQFALLSMSDDA